MKYRLLLLFPVLLLFSCSNRKTQILGTWHVIKWQTPTYDSFFAKAQHYIDTIGRGHSDSENMQIYGVANMDSMRKILQQQYDSAKTVQENSANKALFTFKKDGVAEITLNDSMRTGKWLMDNENGLILEEKGFGDAGVSKYQIVSLSETELILRFYEDGDSSTVTFAHERK